MKQLYNLAYIVQDENDIFFSDLSWIVEVEKESDLLELLEEYNKQLEKGMIVYNKLPLVLPLSELSFDKVLEDIKNM
jgi:hypothetical protein